ncbi:putative domain HDIG-containing protein [Chryseobacterium sp. StRB126]|nr:putative domain HDIG-containing protein [Chryseobacterium sp. StRB126]
MNTAPDAMYAYEQLYKAGRSGLRQNTQALQAYSNAIKNNKLRELGFSDELLARVNGYNPAAYDEILTDLDKLGSTLQRNNTKLENFNATISILTGGNGNYRQGVHWIIQDLGQESSFASKTLMMEVAVENARETFSFIDLVCKGCSRAGTDLMIEYKSGPGSITSGTIKKQFIERDLFKANSLDEIQWRTKNTNISPDNLKSWLKDNKNAINDIIQGNDISLSNKYKGYFKINERSNVVTDVQIDNFVDNNFSKIFK